MVCWARFAGTGAAWYQHMSGFHSAKSQSNHPSEPVTTAFTNLHDGLRRFSWPSFLRGWLHSIDDISVGLRPMDRLGMVS